MFFYNATGGPLTAATETASWVVMEVAENDTLTVGDTGLGVSVQSGADLGTTTMLQMDRVIAINESFVTTDAVSPFDDCSVTRGNDTWIEVTCSIVDPTDMSVTGYSWDDDMVLSGWITLDLAYQPDFAINENLTAYDFWEDEPVEVLISP